MTVFAPAPPTRPVDADQLMSDVPRALYRDWDAELARSRAPTGRWTDFEAALYNACMDAAAGNWDGYGANAVSTDSAAYAHRLLTVLPTAFPAPSIGVDADGEISLEWHGLPGSLLSVSVSPVGAVTYAGIVGASRVRGREPHDTRFPIALLALLQRMFDHGGRLAP